MAPVGGGIEIDGRRIGAGAPALVIAEAGVNHNGDVELALRLVDAAAACGADAVKFQTFTAETLAAPSAAKAAYQQRNQPDGRSQLDMLRDLELDEDAHRRLADRCRARGIRFLSTPFDAAAADLLESLGVPAFKIGSGDLTNDPLLRHVAAKGRPMLVSTGMAGPDEVGHALAVVEAAGDPRLALLHCVSGYPADPAEANLRAIPELARRFGRPVGWSDHTPGTAVALAAVALGACVIEKHLTLDRGMPGPDHRASLEPPQLAALVRDLRIVEQALGDGRKRPMPSELDAMQAARRSLVAVCDIPSGAIIRESMIALRRPGTGLPPSMIEHVVGRKASRAISSGTLLTTDALADS